MNEWIRIKDRLPEHNQYVLVFDGKFMNVCFTDIKSYDYLFMISSGTQVTGVTHWMPLPEKPNAS